MNELEKKIYELITTTPMIKFQGKAYIPVRIQSQLQDLGVCTLQQVFEIYDDRTKLLIVKNIGRKTINDFVSALKYLERHHGIKFEWLKKLGPAFEPTGHEKE